MSGHIRRTSRAFAACALTACALTACALGTDVGLVKRLPGDGTGGSLTAHSGYGYVADKLLVLSLDVRGDVGTSGDRVALGGSFQGGLPIGPVKLLARAGVWCPLASNVSEYTVVPTFELGGFAPLRESFDPKHPEYGYTSQGIVFGLREDVDRSALTSVFVGYAWLLNPGF